MKVQIKLINKEVEDRNDLLGINEEIGSYAEFNFNENNFDGYWVDPDLAEIIFYVSGHSFYTPYTVKTEGLFSNIISNQKK